MLSRAADGFGERSGYDLRKLADHSVRCFWTPAKSRIYATLPPSRGRGPRHASRDHSVRQARQAALPADGGRRGRLRSGSPEDPNEPDVNRNTLLVRLYFGELVEPGDPERIREHRAAAEQLKAEIEAIDAEGREASTRGSPGCTASSTRSGHSLGEGGRARAARPAGVRMIGRSLFFLVVLAAAAALPASPPT